MLVFILIQRTNPQSYVLHFNRSYYDKTVVVL